MNEQEAMGGATKKRKWKVTGRGKEAHGRDSAPEENQPAALGDVLYSASTIAVLPVLKQCLSSYSDPDPTQTAIKSFLFLNVNS